MQRQRSPSHTFDDRISEYRANLEARLQTAYSPTEKQQIKRKLRQLETAANINEWLTSPNLQIPRGR